MSTVIGAIVATVALGVTGAIVGIAETEATGLAVSTANPAKGRARMPARRVMRPPTAVPLPSRRRIELGACRGWRTHPRYLPLYALRSNT